MFTLEIDSPQTKEIRFETQKDVFIPTDTSKLLIEAVKRTVQQPQKTLDLGCGCGVVGISLARLGFCREPLFASDLSENAAVLTRRNARMNSVSIDARYGSLFEPWAGEKFDLIVDDIAGVSDDIAEISPWYPLGVSCNAGRSGTKWINQVIAQARGHLNPGGVFIFPVLSISNEGDILQTLRKHFDHYEMILKKDWFLPDEVASREDVLLPLIHEGNIKCQKKFGKWIWTTAIYQAVNRNE